MLLIGSLSSPFVRMIRALCAELDVDFTFEEMPPFTKMEKSHIARLTQANPLMKIPVLIDGEQSVLESRMIAAYVMAKKQGLGASFAAPGPVEQENILSVIYGVVDSGILRFIMSGQGMDLESGYLKKSLKRMHAGLQFLEAQNTLGQDFGYNEIALICAMEWFEKRGLIDLSSYTRLGEIHALYKDRSCLATTRIPEQI
ncbi:MAG: glutathione S-transferase [Alphaproteobacteria bacterium]|nr:glutathione S-transferase [Alphaproteobacteria bacterium]